MDLAACEKAISALERAHAAPDLEAALQSLADHLAGDGEPDAKKARSVLGVQNGSTRRPVVFPNASPGSVTARAARSTTARAHFNIPHR